MTKVFRFHFEFLAAMNLAEQHADNLAEFTDTLMQSRFWHVLPAGETDLQNAVGFLDTRATCTTRRLQSWAGSCAITPSFSSKVS